MNRTPHPPPHSRAQAAEALRRQILELQGYQEIGMQKQALQLARRLLTRYTTISAAVSEALWAVLVHANGLKRWRRLVERAYGCLPRREQRKVRAQMLGFYVSVEDWKAAESLLSQKPVAAQELMLAMWTFLNLHKLEDAARIERNCRRRLQIAHDPFERSTLIEALASYHAQIGELASAEEFWVSAPPEQPLFENAASGLVQIHAMRARYHVAAGVLALEHAGTGQPELELSLPGIHKSLASNTNEKLLKYDAALRRVLPDKDLWRFGIEADSG
jgi:hypothetical protein